MACPQCGSWSVRADRSLAGRMVCGRCGTPLQGVPRQGGSARRPRRPALLRPLAGWGGRPQRWRWWLVGLLAAGAALAALAPERPRPRQPAPFSAGPGEPLSPSPSPSFSPSPSHAPSRSPLDAPTDRPDHRWQ